VISDHTPIVKGKMSRRERERERERATYSAVLVNARELRKKQRDGIRAGRLECPAVPLESPRIPKTDAGETPGSLDAIHSHHRVGSRGRREK